MKKAFLRVDRICILGDVKETLNSAAVPKLVSLALSGKEGDIQVLLVLRGERQVTRT